MTKENLKKTYKHYCNIIDGTIDEQTLKTQFSSIDPKHGIPQERVDLIKADAKRHKEDIEKKHPDLIKEFTKKETPKTETKKSTKSKES